MKKLITLILLILALLSKRSDGAQLLQETLPNGMQVVVKENTSNDAVFFGCLVKTGSIHEHEQLGSGISHYLEHIVSGGTTSSMTENDYDELKKELGISQNAYTNFSGTNYHIKSDKSNMDVALKILTEQIKDCSFDAYEVDREKDVIVKEYVYRVSTPQAKVRKSNRGNVFPNTNYVHDILGNIDQFKALEREDLIDYYEKRYVPNNMIFVACGNFDAYETMEKIEESFSDFHPMRLMEVPIPEQKMRLGTYRYENEFEIVNPQVYLTRILDPGDYKDFPAIDMALEILFGKRTAPVKYKLFEEEKLVNWIYGYFNNGGKNPQTLFEIGFGINDHEKIDGTIERIYREIASVLETGITQKQIDDVINRYNAFKLLNVKSAEQEAESIAWNMYKYNVPERLDIYIDILSRVKPIEVESAIEKYFLDGNRIECLALPEGTIKNSEDEEEYVLTDVKVIELDNDSKLLHKQSTKNAIVNGAIYIPVSAEYESTENFGLLDFMVKGMVKFGTEKYDALTLSSWIEDHYVTLNGNNSTDGTYFSFKCTKNDLPDLVDILIDIMQNPTFEEEQIEIAQRNAETLFQRSKSDPSTFHTDFRNSILYKGQRDSLSSEERNNIIQGISQKSLIKAYNKYFNADSTIISLYGDLSEDEAIEYSTKLREAIPEEKDKGEIVPLVVPSLRDKYENEYSYEQCNINFNYPAPTIFEEDYYALNMINLFFTVGRRLFKATRQDNDLTYYSSSYYSARRNYGFFRISTQTNLEKKDTLISVIQHEVQRMKNGDVTQEEIDELVDSYLTQLRSNITENNEAGYHLKQEALGLGYNYPFDSEEKFRNITPETIAKIAKKYLSNEAIFVSYPNKDVERSFN